MLDRNDNIAASWGFRGIIAHWNRKHAKAVDVPSLMQFPPPEYSYGAIVQLFEGTDVLLLLAAVSAGGVYDDTGIKIEDVGTEKPAIKRRSQFRVRHDGLNALYRNTEVASVT